MFDVLAVTFWGLVVRVGQAIVEAAPTMLCGVVAAGALRRMIGVDGMRRLFGTTGWRSHLRAWAIGMLLPSCSLGVLPIGYQLRRAGVPGGTVLSFLLAAPHLNPPSLLYGLTLSEPFIILCFALSSLVLSLCAGALWDRLFPEDTVPPATVEALPPPGLRRLAAVLVESARVLTGPVVRYWLIALLGVGFVAVAIPAGSLQATMKHSDPLSPLLMLAVAIPVYDPPMKAMMQLGLMFEHGNSIGAAFVLFLFAQGVNLGTLVWVAWQHGIRGLVAWFSVLIVLVLAMAYVAEPLLYFKEHEEPHTHAFDDFASAFHYGTAPGGLGPLAWQKIDEKLHPFEGVSLGCLAALALLSASLRRTGWDVDAFLNRQPEVATATTERPKFDLVIPRHILALLILLGLFGFAVVGAYVYFPSAEVAFEEMFHMRANVFAAIASGQREDAIRDIEHWDLMTRKVQVGVFLRSGTLGEEPRKLADDLREELEDLRDKLLAGELDEARAKRMEVEKAYRACRKAFLPDAVAHKD